jgi:hypothetical protein
MNKNLKFILGVAVVSVIVGAVGASLFKDNQALKGVYYDPQEFVGDVYQGLGKVLMFQSGEFVGPINTSQSVTLSGANVVTGSFTVDAIGSGMLTLAATTTAQTLTAAQVCDNAVVDWPTTTSTGSLTLPTAVALQADCLDTVGSYRDVVFRNTDSVATSSYSFTAGASSTIKSNFATSSQSTNAVDSAQGAILRFVYGTSTTSNATMVQILANFFR